MRRSLSILPVGLLLCTLAGAAPQSRSEQDTAIATTLLATGEQIERASVRIYVTPGALDAAVARKFADQLETAVVGIREYLGHNVQLVGSPAKSELTFFVSSDAGISRASRSRPHAFIHPRKIARKRAPYVHEAVHAMAAWSRGAQWISEGFANHVAAAVVARSGGYHFVPVDPRGLSSVDEHLGSQYGAEVLPLIGAVGSRRQVYDAHRELVDKIGRERRTYAAAFYVLAWSFVDYLIAHVGVDGLRAIAEASGEDAAVMRTTSKTISQWKDEWLQAVRAEQEQ